MGLGVSNHNFMFAIYLVNIISWRKVAIFSSQSISILSYLFIIYLYTIYIYTIYHLTSFLSISLPSYLLNKQLRSPPLLLLLFPSHSTSLSYYRNRFHCVSAKLRLLHTMQFAKTTRGAVEK